MIELQGFLIDLGLLELLHLMYFRLLAGFFILVFFLNLSFVGLQVEYLALFRIFSVIDGFRWFLMGTFHKSIQLMLELLKGPFLFQQFHTIY